ncbi:MAG: 30S ribosomal protein S4e [Candidatus Aenigmatarchaeota archaeon]|jgi:small subunit ribosomal protein S4e
MAHLKRLLAPSFWRVPKKEKKWVVTPHAGPHPKLYSIPLSIILTHIINIANTTAEAKKIIRKGEIFVDGKRRKDYAYPVGLFDIISIPTTKKHYRVVPSTKGLELIETSEKETNLKICRVDNKSILKKGKTQLNLHDGKNILVENGNYKTGDSLLLELPSLKIIDHLPLEKGNVGIISHGTGAGRLGEIKQLMKGTMREPQKVVCEIDKEDRIVSKHGFIVVGKEKPVMKIS